MNRKLKPGLAVGAVLTVALGGGAAAVAHNGGAPKGERPLDRRALLEEAASRLGVEPAELRRALLGALGDELDEAVAAGRLTEEQAERIKARARARGTLPLFGPRAGRPRHHGIRGGVLAEAASYLGLPASEVREALRSGRTLADVAEEEGKSVPGLRRALLEAARERLQDEVDAGRLPQAWADRALARVSRRIDALVEGRFRPAPAPLWGGGRAA